MTELLFLILVYLVASLPTTLYLRFIGLPDDSHRDYLTCYEEVYLGSGNYKRTLVCQKGRMGGKPQMLILWVVWTILWPLPFVVIVLYNLVCGAGFVGRQIEPLVDLLKRAVTVRF